MDLNHHFGADRTRADRSASPASRCCCLQHGAANAGRLVSLLAVARIGCCRLVCADLWIAAAGRDAALTVAFGGLLTADALWPICQNADLFCRSHLVADCADVFWKKLARCAPNIRC